MSKGLHISKNELRISFSRPPVALLSDESDQSCAPEMQPVTEYCGVQAVLG